MPGAGGISAANAVLVAQPDGYTPGRVTNGTAISVAPFNSLPFDPAKDFERVSTIGTFDLVFAVNANSPHKTPADFMAAAKAQPGKLNIGTINVGWTQNLGGETVQVDGRPERPDRAVPQLARYRRGASAGRRQMLVEYPAAVQGQVASQATRVRHSGHFLGKYLDARR
jgi:hypothetical protein